MLNKNTKVLFMAVTFVIILTNCNPATPKMPYEELGYIIEGYGTRAEDYYPEIYVYVNTTGFSDPTMKLDTITIGNTICRYKEKCRVRMWANKDIALSAFKKMETGKNLNKDVQLSCKQAFSQLAVYEKISKSGPSGLAVYHTDLADPSSCK